MKDYKINKIQVDDEYVYSNSYLQKITTEGEHKIRVNIDIKNSSSLEGFFENINELISINFTNDFNTTNIENMNEMFSSSKNLISIYFSNINTENVTFMKRMFNSCIKLQKID